MPFSLRATLNLLIVAIFLAAMTTVGFAHRMSVQETDPDLLAYLAAGGALEDICGVLEDNPHGLSQSCEACRLVDTAEYPTHFTTLRRAALVHTRRLQHVAQLRHHAKPLDTAQLTRAPPHA